MTREDLVKLIYLSDYCPEYNCNSTSTDDICKECGSKALTEYENQIRAVVIDEYHKEMLDMIEGNEEFTDWQKYEILQCNDLVKENLKEHNQEGQTRCRNEKGVENE